MWSRNWYMAAKCMWKLLEYSAEVELRHQEIVTALVNSIKHAPGKDLRHPEKGPTLEPHYKLLSVVHKMVFHLRLMVC